MSKNIKLKINAVSGKIDLQCPEEYFETAMEQCTLFVSSFPRSTSVEEKLSNEKLPDSSRELPGNSGLDNSISPPKDEVGKPKRTRSKSSKPPSYTRIDLKLSDEQARELRRFYSEKAPSNQNDIVCVVAYKLKEFLNKDSFSVDEIFSGIQLLEGVQTPRNLKAVFKNTFDQGNGVFDSGEFKANFATDDYVNLKLPKAKD